MRLRQQRDVAEQTPFHVTSVWSDGVITPRSRGDPVFQNQFRHFPSTHAQRFHPADLFEGWN